jgi:hypothetical protein
MNESVENVFVNETLRGRRAPAHLPCQDRDEVGGTPGAPVPANVPGDFTVPLGAVVAGETLEGLEAEVAALGVDGPLTMLEWVEAEVPELAGGLRLIRGAVMAVAAGMAGW